MKDILTFQGEYRWLSNFYPCTVVIESFVFKNAEAAYQSKKSKDWQKDVWGFAELSAWEAKMAGKALDLREDWDVVKVDVMRQVVESKFRNNKMLACKLLETGDVKLIEGNNWGDTYWGVCNGRGMNWLGHILMDLRQRIQKEAK